MNWQQLFTRHFNLLLETLVVFGINSSVLSGQETVSGYTQPNLIKTIQMVPPNQSLAFPFWVDQTTSFSMTVSSLIKNLGIQLIDPNGSVFVFGQALSDSFKTRIYPDPQTVPDAPGAHYYLNFENPVKGQWSLTINTPNTLSSLTSIPLQINFNNQVGPVIFGGGGSSPLGSNISFGMAVVDGVNKVGSLQISAMLIRLDDPTVPPVPISFTDDGQGADYAAGDSIYSVYLTPSQVGNYMLQIEVSGDASTGHFQRSIASGFKIVPKTARIVGSFKERVIPANPR